MCFCFYDSDKTGSIPRRHEDEEYLLKKVNIRLEKGSGTEEILTEINFRFQLQEAAGFIPFSYVRIRYGRRRDVILRDGRILIK